MVYQATRLNETSISRIILNSHTNTSAAKSVSAFAKGLNLRVSNVFCFDLTPH
jgi:hypothetical protein